MAGKDQGSTRTKRTAAKRSAKRSAGTSAKRSATQRTAKKRAARPKAEDFPRRIFAIASPRSVGGVSMFEAGELITSATVANFESDPDIVTRAREMLIDAGFEVLDTNTAMINFCGPRSTFERAFSTELTFVEHETIKPGGIVGTSTFIDTTDTDMSGYVDVSRTRFGEVLEGVAIEEPYYPMADSIPPRVDSWYLNVPDDVAVVLNASRAHRAGRTGRDIRVAMVDTGWYRHPFFTARGYRSNRAILGPGAANRDDDESGHGTGESANVFATAPDVRLLPVKAANASGALVNLTAAFNAAVQLNPDVITNSWGASLRTGPLSAARQAQAAAVAAAVASGIVVCFSAGNGHWGFPGQHPDVISVGGVFRDRDGSLQASDYSSGFVSNIYPGRQSPDVCGLVGMRPGASYIMLPVQDGDDIDVRKANGGNGVPADGTATDDGWALFSGTSAACPQVAGVVALMKQACPRLTPAEIRDILKRTAVDITVGASHPATPGTTGPGPDTATGAGLVDASRAVAIARLRCLLGPRRPRIPTPPRITLPQIRPAAPLGSLPPLQPIAPFLTTAAATDDGGSGDAASSADAAEIQGRLTEDELSYLEELVVDGDDLMDEI